MIDPQDLRIDCYRYGSGKPVTLVKVTHVPTGAVAECDKHRSQHANREAAIAELEAKLCPSC